MPQILLDPSSLHQGCEIVRLNVVVTTEKFLNTEQPSYFKMKFIMNLRYLLQCSPRWRHATLLKYQFWPIYLHHIIQWNPSAQIPDSQCYKMKWIVGSRLYGGEGVEANLGCRSSRIVQAVVVVILRQSLTETSGSQSPRLVLSVCLSPQHHNYKCVPRHSCV